MKNNLIKQLKDAADKQEIHDLSKDIIENVNTDKVLTPTYIPKKKFNFIPLLVGGLSACAITFIVGLSIGLNKNGSNANIPSDIPSDIPGEENIVIDFTNEEDEVVRTLLSKFSTQESYNIINIANSLTNVSYDVVDFSNQNSMNSELENILVNDINSYMYNIEDMFELSDAVVSTVSDNRNTLYDYSKDLQVVSPYYEYHLYYDETIYEENYDVEDNPKIKSKLVGVIVVDDNVIGFETNKVIKNGDVTYNSTIKLTNSNYVDVESKFTSDRYFFTYTYVNGDNKKVINIEQNNKYGYTKNVRFNSIENQSTDSNAVPTYYFQVELTKNDDNTLNAKIKSRDESITIAKSEESYTYTFKKSGNVYTK